MDNIKVLMVDDESRMRKLVSDFLTRKGYIVIEAGDGEEALDRFYADKDISLVILAVRILGLKGFAIYSSAPHSNPFNSLDSSLLAVSIIIGTLEFFLISLHTSQPFILGIITSRITSDISLSA